MYPLVGWYKYVSISWLVLPYFIQLMPKNFAQQIGNSSLIHIYLPHGTLPNSCVSMKCGFILQVMASLPLAGFSRASNVLALIRTLMLPLSSRRIKVNMVMVLGDYLVVGVVIVALGVSLIDLEENLIMRDGARCSLVLAHCLGSLLHLEMNKLFSNLVASHKLVLLAFDARVLHYN